MGVIYSPAPTQTYTRTHAHIHLQLMVASTRLRDHQAKPSAPTIHRFTAIDKLWTLDEQQQLLNDHKPNENWTIC